LEESELN